MMLPERPAPEAVVDPIPERTGTSAIIIGNVLVARQFRVVLPGGIAQEKSVIWSSAGRSVKAPKRPRASTAGLGSRTRARRSASDRNMPS